MAVTISAIIFLLILLVIAIAGTRLMLRKGSSGNPEEGRCILCGASLPVHQLVSRQIGDYRIVHFCRPCIMKLYADMGGKN